MNSLSFSLALLCTLQAASAQGGPTTSTNAEDLIALIRANNLDGLRRLDANPNVVSRLGEAPLHYAATYGSVDSVRILLERGADPNAPVEKAVRPLHYAAKCDSREVVDALLAAGANPQLKDGEHEATASDWARFFGNFDLAGYLERVEG